MSWRRYANYFYAGGGLAWAAAGLDGALKEDLGGPFVFRAFAAAGGVFLFVALFLTVVAHVANKVSFEKAFDVRHVKRKELQEMRDFSQNFVSQVPSIERLQAIFDASRCCVWWVERSSSLLGERSSKRIGFFSIIKLNDDAVRLLSSNSIDGLRFDRSHICGPRKKAKGLYVGGMGARGVRAKGWLVQHVRARISQFFDDGGSVVFTRPVTDDGLRLAKKLGFLPVVPSQDGMGNIYRLES
ncbi:hypothetical protein [Lysobacter antibioticus]|uniref:hypothetical protein n=1 Tax=Lysobacter antibioticus TaxID=84531 RepID=UPI000AC6783A|nr:hypothetical protein [Lysobacter antibioticus]